MNNIVAEWYEDKKNVDEMQNWNFALKEWEQSVWYAYSLEPAFVEECADVEGSGGALQVVILFVADLWGVL